MSSRVTFPPTCRLLTDGWRGGGQRWQSVGLAAMQALLLSLILAAAVGGPGLAGLIVFGLLVGT